MGSSAAVRELNLPGWIHVRDEEDLEDLAPGDPGYVLLPSTLVPGVLRLSEHLTEVGELGDLCRALELMIYGFGMSSSELITSGINQVQALIRGLALDGLAELEARDAAGQAAPDAGRSWFLVDDGIPLPRSDDEALLEEDPLEEWELEDASLEELEEEDAPGLSLEPGPAAELPELEDLLDLDARIEEVIQEGKREA